MGARLTSLVNHILTSSKKYHHMGTMARRYALPCKPTSVSPRECGWKRGLRRYSQVRYCFAACAKVEVSLTICDISRCPVHAILPRFRFDSSSLHPSPLSASNLNFRMSGYRLVNLRIHQLSVFLSFVKGHQFSCSQIKTATLKRYRRSWPREYRILQNLQQTYSHLIRLILTAENV